MLALQRPGWRVEGLEIQPELVALARQNAAQCGLKIAFHEGDICSFTHPYDLIVSNPPWRPLGSGKPSPSEARNISRFELLCSMSDVLACVKRNLSPSGDALLLYPQSRTDELARGAKNSLLDISSLFPAAGLQEHIICHIRHKGQ